MMRHFTPDLDTSLHTQHRQYHAFIHFPCGWLTFGTGGLLARISFAFPPCSNTDRNPTLLLPSHHDRSCPTAFLPHYKPRFVRFDIYTQCQKRNRGQRAPAGEARSEVAGAASEVAEEETRLTKRKTK